MPVTIAILTRIALTEQRRRNFDLCSQFIVFVLQNATNLSVLKDYKWFVNINIDICYKKVILI